MCLDTEEKLKLIFSNTNPPVKPLNASELLDTFPKSQDLDDEGQFDNTDNNDEFFESENFEQNNIESSSEKAPAPEPHRCDICNKEFISKHAMQKHKKIHQNCPELICEICNKQFTRYIISLK